MQIAPMNPWVTRLLRDDGQERARRRYQRTSSLPGPRSWRTTHGANGWFLGGVDEGGSGVIEPGRLGDIACSTATTSIGAGSRLRLNKNQSVLDRARRSRRPRPRRPALGRRHRAQTRPSRTARRPSWSPAAACSTKEKPATANEQPPIVVGSTLSLTGAFAATGSSTRSRVRRSSTGSTRRRTARPSGEMDGARRPVRHQRRSRRSTSSSSPRTRSTSSWGPTRRRTSWPRWPWPSGTGTSCPSTPRCWRRS